ncbi:hypothetical protein FAES_4868 [Fibrella aestuarina BUZ 2]|uniref:Uncharacterized protein n=1 Tax=Fibrella aestuarina BUZ 2 TaxID=1166018 RepID=I0KFG4_9BACT|nr:hypothetical protein FAES_4868 [Fibrella aestuarina BUZ 2]
MKTTIGLLLATVESMLGKSKRAYCTLYHTLFT